MVSRPGQFPAAIVSLIQRERGGSVFFGDPHCTEAAAVSLFFVIEHMSVDHLAHRRRLEQGTQILIVCLE